MQLVIAVTVLVLAGATVGVVIARRATGRSEQTSPEAATAALVPLSQFPVGTAKGPANNDVNDNASCPGGSTASAPVDVQETVRPPSGPALFEEVQIDTTSGGAALVANVRAQLDCGTVQDTTNDITWTVLTLGFPSLGSNEAAYQLSGATDVETVTADIIAVQVNSVSALTVGTISTSGPPDVAATVKWARQALKRAHAQLGG